MPPSLSRPSAARFVPFPHPAPRQPTLPPSPLLCNVRAGPVPRRSGPGPTKPAWNAVLRAHGVRSGRGYGVSGCRSVRIPRSRQIATSLVFFPMLLRRSRVDGALAGPYSTIKGKIFFVLVDRGWGKSDRYGDKW